MAESRRLEAVIYARYSPRPSDTNCLANQMEGIVAWCEQHNIEPVCFGFDMLVSGNATLFDRPGLRYCFKHLRGGRVLVVRNLDRLARDVIMALSIEKEVFKTGARLASVENGGILKNNPQDRMVRIIQYAVAEYQKSEKAHRTSRRILERLYRNHESLFKIEPYGYRVKGKKLVRHEPEQAIILDILKWRALAEPVSYSQIAKELNRQKRFRRNGKPWTKQYIIDVRRAIESRLEFEPELAKYVPDRKENDDDES